MIAFYVKYTNLPFLRNTLFTREVLHFNKFQWEVQRSHYPLQPHTHTHISPTINTAHQTVISVINGEATLPHHYHQNSTVYIKVHSWCCTF